MGADNIGITAVDQLQHFGGQKPALPHIIAVANDALDEGLGFLIGGGGAEGGRVERVVQDALQMLQIPQGALVGTILEEAATVQLVIRQISIHAIHDEIQETGEHVLAVLLLQEFF